MRNGIYYNTVKECLLFVTNSFASHSPKLAQTSQILRQENNSYNINKVCTGLVCLAKLPVLSFPRPEEGKVTDVFTVLVTGVAWRGLELSMKLEKPQTVKVSF